MTQNNATVKSKEEELHDRKVAEEQRQQQLELARAKKEKMLRIEEEKKRSVPPNEFEREQLEKAQAINEKALEARKEDLEDVKEMNKMVAYAKAVTIRDRQLQEKEQVWEEYRAQEKKKDLIMEVERLKQIKYLEEEEDRKKQEVVRGHQVIIEQIKEREIDRLKQKEEQEREAQQLLRAADELKKEEEAKSQKKKEMQAKINQEIVDANRNTILVNQQRRLREREEDEKIAQYNVEKAQKAAELEAEQKYLLEFMQTHQRRKRKGNTTPSRAPRKGQ